MVKNLKQNLIVNAIGSVPLLPPIPGLHKHLGKPGSNVCSILDMIENLNRYPADLSGKKVVGIGGGAVGLDIVEYFSPRGAETSIVELLSTIGNVLDPATKVHVFSLMEKYNVRQLPGTKAQIRPGRLLSGGDAGR